MKLICLAFGHRYIQIDADRFWCTRCPHEGWKHLGRALQLIQQKRAALAQPSDALKENPHG